MTEFNLDRFVEAQAPVYAQALTELRSGRKQSHWMWFVFPQLKGLGRSATAQHYGISSAAEARSYLAHELLGPRLIECTEAVLAHQGRQAEAIFGPVDAMKFHSSMTLFEAAAGDREAFALALRHFYGGRRDEATLRLLGDG
ncbi:MAG: DUF1810 domain-containing protein [Pseudomonadota bacterium]|nr:DUF1810 domain-containing protein [Pseudomonadota bacterium]